MWKINEDLSPEPEKRIEPRCDKCTKKGKCRSLNRLKYHLKELEGCGSIIIAQCKNFAGEEE